MSLILDALKKAESERARGALPDLRTDQESSTRYISHGGTHPAVWLLVATVLVGVAGAAWFWRSGAGLPAPVAGPAHPEPPVAVAPAVPATAAQPLPALQTATQPGAVSAVAPVRATPPVPAAATGSNAPAAPAATAAAPAATAAAVRTPAGAAIPALGELPESVRRQLPPIAINGAVYSDAPPEWTLIVNDQVLGRGGQVAPDLLLEEVSASSAVFNFRGHRFRIDR